MSQKRRLNRMVKPKTGAQCARLVVDGDNGFAHMAPRSWSLNACHVEVVRYASGSRDASSRSTTDTQRVARPVAGALLESGTPRIYSRGLSNAASPLRGRGASHEGARERD